MSDLEEKSRIETAAAERFLGEGVYKVTLDEIATDLHVSKKTVYKFFPTKEDLLRGVVHTMLHRVERSVETIVSSNNPFEQKMAELLMLLGNVSRKIGRQFQADLQRFAPSLWEEIETFRRERIFPRVQRIFQQAKDERLFRNDINLDLFFLVFLGTVQGIMNPKTLSQQSFSADEAFRGIFKLLFQGALTPEAQARFKFFDVPNTDNQFTRSL